MIVYKPLFAVPKPEPKEPRRLPRDMNMTIAAGFFCKDGLLIAADTQESGYMKSDVHKYEYIRTQSWIGAVLGAGDAEYVEMCKQKLLSRFATSDSAPVPSMAAIEDYVLALFDRHFAPLSIYPAKERPEAHMLIAVQPNEKNGSLATWLGTAFVEHYPYAFVGLGAQMATHIGQKVRGAGLFLQPMRQVAGIAIYILGQVKTTVDGCGGQTEIAMLGKDGHAYYLSPDLILEREHKYKNLDWKEMLSLADKIMEDCEEEEIEPF